MLHFLQTQQQEPVECLSAATKIFAPITRRPQSTSPCVLYATIHACTRSTPIAAASVGYNLPPSYVCASAWSHVRLNLVAEARAQHGAGIQEEEIIVALKKLCLDLYFTSNFTLLAFLPVQVVSFLSLYVKYMLCPSPNTGPYHAATYLD